jgi:lipoate-protein ligase B
MDLAPFQQIHPCGFADCLVTSMSTLRGAAISLDKIKQDLAQTFGEVFSIEWTTVAQHVDSHLATSDGLMPINRFNL